MRPPATRPLEGLLVVALEQAVAAPLCTMRLAEAGARVIKIERPEGDFARGYDHVVHGESSYFVWLNRAKESLVLDLRQADDIALLGRLVEKADIFVQNLAPGAAGRLGFGSAELRAKYPRLITCDISGYGEDGPYRDMKAYDLLIQGESGLAMITGAPEAPGRVGVSVADIACGMNAHAGILQALLLRGRTGQGSGLQVSLFDSLADWMTVPLMHTVYGGKSPRRVGLAHPSIAPYGAFATRDGRQVILSIQNDREWASLCRGPLNDAALIEDPRFRSNADRVANRPACDGLVAAALGALSHAEAVAALDKAKVAYGNLNTPEDLARHPQLRRIAADTPTGPVDLVAGPVRWVDLAETTGPVPSIGQHTAAIRKEFMAGN